MADTLEQIFNVDLDKTDMASGESTVLTTNADTRYVIKDIHVNNGSSITNADLELNGFNVADLTKTNSGSLIVPPSSTLKIKSNQFPLVLEDINYTYVPSNNNSIIFEDAQGFIGTAPQEIDNTEINKPTAGQPYYPYILTDTHVYYQTDWNGDNIGQIRYSALSDLSTQLTVSTDSYTGNMVFDGRYIMWQQGSQINRWDTTTNTASDVSLSQNKTNSSYPRNFYITGTRYVFHTSSSGGFRLVNADTGSTINLSLSPWPTQDSSYYQIFAVYNPTTDILWLGSFNSTSPNMVVYKLESASTYLDVTSGTQSVTPTQVFSALNASVLNKGDIYLSQYALLGKAEGNKTWLYFTENGQDSKIKRIDLSESSASINTLSATNETAFDLTYTAYSYNDGVLMGYINETTSAEQTARNYNFSVYDIKAHATGVKVV